MPSARPAPTAAGAGARAAAARGRWGRTPARPRTRAPARGRPGGRARAPAAARARRRAAALRLSLDQLSALGAGGRGRTDEEGAAGTARRLRTARTAGRLRSPRPPTGRGRPARHPSPAVAASVAPGSLPLAIGSRKKSVNMTECVPVPSSEHVAEIVGRQGCKIKALRAKTNTYIKTPVRGEEPVFIVTGRKEDVEMAKREILSAAEHFSIIRATRSKAGGLPGTAQGPPNLPGQTTIQVRVPYRVVGLVVGPKGATIKRIQQRTHTYIVTPGRDKEPVFAVTGMPENVDRAREEIEAHITLRTGAFTDAGPDSDFHANGTDVCLDLLGAAASLWAKTPNPGRRVPPRPCAPRRGHAGVVPLSRDPALPPKPSVRKRATRPNAGLRALRRRRIESASRWGTVSPEDWRLIGFSTVWRWTVTRCHRTGHHLGAPLERGRPPARASCSSGQRIVGAGTSPPLTHRPRPGSSAMFPAGRRPRDAVGSHFPPPPSSWPAALDSGLPFREPARKASPSAISSAPPRTSHVSGEVMAPPYAVCPRPQPLCMDCAVGASMQARSDTRVFPPCRTAVATQAIHIFS
uniref:K Homology domain-containing protein n=1 Tax=Aotus nancymaae TaxID=37293 RepID=A0A2K5DQF8_AOTNA